MWFLKQLLIDKLTFGYYNCLWFPYYNRAVFYWIKISFIWIKLTIAYHKYLPNNIYYTLKFDFQLKNKKTPCLSLFLGHCEMPVKIRVHGPLLTHFLIWKGSKKATSKYYWFTVSSRSETYLLSFTTRR